MSIEFITINISPSDAAWLESQHYVRPICRACRYWSDLVAKKVDKAFDMEALCLSPDSSCRGAMTQESATCSHWKIGDLGAVDEDGRDVLRYQHRDDLRAEVARRSAQIERVELAAKRIDAAMNPKKGGAA